MDGPSTLHLHSTAYKRRSPPPLCSSSPSPGPPYPNGTASALSFSSRSANPRNSFSTIASQSEDTLSGAGSFADEPGIMSGGESSSAVHASPGVGGYAYSTTLRRQPSLEPMGYPPQRVVSPHHASPYRKRTSSNAYNNGGPPIDLDPEGQAQELGMVMKLWRRARRVIGRRDYAELRQDEAEQRISAERRARETPSAIYAHKSIEVSPYPSPITGLTSLGHNIRVRHAPDSRALQRIPLISLISIRT